jgi:hypothetical protein
LIPAATARYERDLVAVGAPTGRAIAGRVLRDEGLVRALHVDHPDPVASNERDPTAIRRPVGIAGRLLRRGQLLGVAAANRHQEDLPSSPDLGRERHSTAIRRQTELTR